MFNHLAFAAGQVRRTRGVVTIYEYERGLLYHRGRLVRELGAGRYRIWPLTHRAITVLDIRRAVADVANQKLLTADQVTVGLNLSAEYEVADVVAALHRVADYRAQLHDDVQMAARQVLGEAPVDALLAERVQLAERLLAFVAPRAADYGLRVLAVGIKDVILAPKVRDLLMKEAEARRVAQAALIGAREEVSALRALANAARLAEQHPSLLKLRELDAVRAFAQTGRNTVVMGVSSVPGLVAAPGGPPATDAETE